MLSDDPEILGALKFWAAVGLMLAGSVWAGRLAATQASPYVLVVFLAAAAAVLTFYSPKLALGLIVFSMLLSPKVPGMQISGAARHGVVLIRFDDVLLIIVFLAWLARSAVFKGSPFLAATPIHLPVFLYTSVCVVSTALAVMQGRYAPLRPAFYVLKYVQYFVLFFMTVNIAKSKEDVRRYLWCGLLTAAAVTAYAYAQIPGGGRITAPFDTPWGASEEEKLRDTEPNTLGGYYLVIFGVLLSFYTQYAGLTSLGMLAVLLWMLPPFLLTLSRASYLGLGISLTFHMLATSRRRAALLFGIAAAFLLLTGVPSVKQAVIERVAYTFTGVEKGYRGEVFRVAGGLNLEPSAYLRFWSWKRIFLTEFPKRPLLGAGVTGVGLADAQYPLVLGETGLLGFSLFLWMLARIWQCSWSLYRLSEDMQDRALALGLMTALAGLMLHGVAANSFIIVRIMEPFWFLVALCARRYVDLARDDSPGPDAHA